MSNRITEERELFLYYYVFGTNEAKELMDLWVNDIINTPHFLPQIDPNNTKTIRDMAVLEFIQCIRNRVQEFIEKGVKNERPRPDNNTSDAEYGQPAIDTGNPDL